MAESTRQRIEWTRANGTGDDVAYLLADLFKSGRLLPADEHEAAVAEAVEGERERIYAAVCKRCAAGNKPFRMHGTYVHDMALSAKEGMQDCAAAAIRQPTQERKEP